MPAIKHILATSGHPHEKLAPNTLAELNRINALLDPSYAKRAGRLFRVVECILQMSGLSITIESLGTLSFTNTIQLCIGLLLQNRILEGTPTLIADYIRHLAKLHDYVIASKGQQVKASLIGIMGKKGKAKREACLAMAGELVLDEEKIWVWGGWTVCNNHHKMHLYLFPVYEKFGRAFTQNLFAACSFYFKGRTVSSIGCFDSFISFLASEYCDYTWSQLMQPHHAKAFLVALANFHVQYNLGKANSGMRPVEQHVLIDEWNSQFRTFAAHYLIPGNVIGSPCFGRATVNDIPSIPGDTSKRAKALSARNKKIHSGVVLKYKTITPIPMHVMDDNVIEGIFIQMRHDLQTAIRWAELCIASIETRLDELADIVITSTAMQPSVTRSNLPVTRLVAERIKSAKIYLQEGFYPSRNFYTSAVSSKHNLTSGDLTDWLCLPKTELLTAFTIYLAAKHEEITNSFLENCLVPHHNKLAGYRVSLNDKFLTGSKPRAKKNIQIVELCEESIWAVEILIRLTNPVRQFLETYDQSSMASTKLFLSTGKGFGRPIQPDTSSMTGTKITQLKNSNSIKSLIDISKEEADYLAENISVNSVRSSSVVMKVIDHLDLTLATSALNHAFFSLSLLEHYIPKLILLYLMRREITNWNTRVLIQALDGDPRTVFLSGFKTKAALEDYLSEAIDLPYPKGNPENPVKGETLNVVIGIDTSIVCILASLELAVKLEPQSATAIAIYWAGFFGALRSWIYSDENTDDYLRCIFESGTKLCNVDLVIGVAYD